MKKISFDAALGLFAMAAILFSCSGQKQQVFCIPLLVGEVSSTSAIFQARLSTQDTLVYRDIHDAESIEQTVLPGAEGEAYFEWSTTADFANARRTSILKATADRDYILKIKVDSLEAGRRYHYRLHYGAPGAVKYISDVHTFSTLPDEAVSAEVNFIMMACYNLDAFYMGADFGKPTTEGSPAYREADKYAGYPGFRTVAQMKPDFFINNGDNVYYDQPYERKVTTQPAMRAKWQRQFGMYTMQQMFAIAPSYWMKDDHDTRFDDADTVSVNQRHGALPSFELGRTTFLEQAPVTDPADPAAKTYRTHKIGNNVQIWILEGRDYRSPNKMEDGPGKSIWGKEQKAWLQKTLLESTAEFKLIISPTPMVGPDDARKTDNHTNLNGFRHERNEFFKWLADNKFENKNLFLFTGDRHWQYHAIDPSGFEEFSCGSIMDQNARLGRKAGDPKSTDPDATIKQPYLQDPASGGFLQVKIRPASGNEKGVMEVSFYDELGKRLYSAQKTAAP